MRGTEQEGGGARGCREGQKEDTEEARRRGARSRSCNCVKTSAVQKHPLETCSHSSRERARDGGGSGLVSFRLVLSRLVSSRLGFSAIRSRKDRRVTFPAAAAVDGQSRGIADLRARAELQTAAATKS